MRLALIGDIHTYRLLVPPWHLVGKRLIGQANLWLNRRHRFDHSLANQLIERAASIQPDMVLLSGDLTTTSLDGEFSDAAQMLAPLTERFPTLIVPGNHDRYTFTSARRRVMETLMPGVVPNEWPCFRHLTERWHLLALDAAVPRIFNSRGRVGQDQLKKIRRITADLTAQDGLIVLCHYPLKSPPRALPLTWDHKLADSYRLRKLLIRCPARLLYLHGHIHKPWCWQPKQSNQAHFTYINAGCPCMTSPKHPRGQGFWQVDLPDDPTGPLQVTHHLPADKTRGPGSDGHGWLAHTVLSANTDPVSDRRAS